MLLWRRRQAKVNETEARRAATRFRQTHEGEKMRCNHCGQEGVVGETLDGCTWLFIYAKPEIQEGSITGARCVPPCILD